MNKLSYVLGAALGAYLLHADIALIEVGGISDVLDVGVLHFLNAGGLVNILIYPPSPDYSILRNQFYTARASETVVPGAFKARTVSSLDQLAVRLCYRQTMEEDGLVRNVSRSSRSCR
jgi:hypothetical protein